MSLLYIFINTHIIEIYFYERGKSMSFKETVNELKKNSKQLNEPFVFAIDTEKSIFLNEDGKEKVAVVGIKLDKNLNPVTNQYGKDVKIAIVVDAAPQKEGKLQEYYRNMTEKELKVKDVLMETWKEEKNPATRIGASVIMYHEVTKLPDDKNVKDADGVVYPSYTASRYCNRIGLDRKEAKTKVLHGIRTKLNIKKTEDGKEKYTLNAFDTDNQVQIDNAKDNFNTIARELNDFYELMCANYKDQAFNKSSVCMSIFADIDGTKKRIGREFTDPETGEVKYVTSPVYLKLFQDVKDENNKTRTEVMPKDKFIEDSINWIKQMTNQFPAAVSISLMPRYFLRCDNLAPTNGKIPLKLAEMLSSGYYDLSIMTSANRMYKGVQLYQRNMQPVPFATVDSKDNEAPLATHEEYLAFVNNSVQTSQKESVKETTESPQPTEGTHEDPGMIAGFF